MQASYYILHKFGPKYIHDDNHAVCIACLEILELII